MVPLSRLSKTLRPFQPPVACYIDAPDYYSFLSLLGRFFTTDTTSDAADGDAATYDFGRCGPPQLIEYYHAHDETAEISSWPFIGFASNVEGQLPMARRKRARRRRKPGRDIIEEASFDIIPDMVERGTGGGGNSKFGQCHNAQISSDTESSEWRLFLDVSATRETVFSFTGITSVIRRYRSSLPAVRRIAAPAMRPPIIDAKSTRMVALYVSSVLLGLHGDTPLPVDLKDFLSYQKFLRSRRFSRRKAISSRITNMAAGITQYRSADDDASIAFCLHHRNGVLTWRAASITVHGSASVEIWRTKSPQNIRKFRRCKI